MISERIGEEVRRLLSAGRAGSEEGMTQVPMGVEYPDGAIAYVAFELPAGADPFVHLFPGEEGLQGYLRMQEDLAEGVFDLLGTDYRDWLEVPYLELDIGGTDEALTEGEKEVCRRVPGLSVWPALRRMTPFLLGREEQDPALIARMEGALAAINWYLDQGDELPGDEELFDCGQLLMITISAGGFAARRVGIPPLQGRQYFWESSRELRGAMLEVLEEAGSLRKLPHSGSFEAALADEVPDELTTSDGLVLPQHAASTEPIGRVVTLALAERHSGTVLEDPDALSVRDFADHPQALLRLLGQYFLEQGSCPREIRVADDRTSRLLHAWCGQAGVRLSRVKKLPELREAWLSAMGEEDWMEEDFSQMLGSVHDALEEERVLPDEDDPWAHLDLDELCGQVDESLAHLTAQELSEMPGDILAEMLLLAELGFLSEHSHRLLLDVAQARSGGMDTGELHRSSAGEKPEEEKKDDNGELSWEMSFEELMRGLDGPEGQEVSE